MFASVSYLSVSYVSWMPSDITNFTQIKKHNAIQAFTYLFGVLQTISNHVSRYDVMRPCHELERPITFHIECLRFLACNYHMEWVVPVICKRHSDQFIPTVSHRHVGMLSIRIEEDPRKRIVATYGTGDNTGCWIISSTNIEDRIVKTKHFSWAIYKSCCHLGRKSYER